MVEAVEDRSDCQAPVAGDLPGFHALPIADNNGLGVQRHGRTDVPRNSKKTVADFEFPSMRSLNNEVLFTGHGGSRVLDSQQLDSGMRHFRGYGFVAKVEANKIWTRLTNDACQH